MKNLVRIMKNLFIGLSVMGIGVFVLWGFSGQYHINCDSSGNCTYYETKDYPEPMTLNHHKFQLRDGDELLCYDTSTRKKSEANAYKVLIRNEFGKTYAQSNGLAWDECRKLLQKLQETLDKEDKSLMFSDNLVPDRIWKMVMLVCAICLWTGIQIILGNAKNNSNKDMH